MSDRQEKFYDRLKGLWVHPFQLEIDRLKHELHYRKKSEESIVSQFNMMRNISDEMVHRGMLAGLRHKNSYKQQVRAILEAALAAESNGDTP